MGIDHADAGTTLICLKLASAQAAASGTSHWADLRDRAIRRFAETIGGDFKALESLPFETLVRILECDSLDTGDREGRVLVAVTRWAQLNDTSKLPTLLKLVRFPLLRLASLEENERD